MRSLNLNSSILAAVFICARAAWAEDYTSFAKLPETEKDRVVWNLHEHHQWGLPEQKPVCRDLLESQGYSFANATAWTVGAIDLAEQQGWKDLAPLVAKIYERPKNIGLYERAFRYLRGQDGKPVSTNLVVAAETLQGAGYYRSAVSDGQLSAAKERLLQETDKEAVLVYALGVAARDSGKGGTDRGRKAAGDVLKGLDRERVVQRIRQLRQDSGVRSEIEWVAKYLEISLEDHQK